MRLELNRISLIVVCAKVRSRIEVASVFLLSGFYVKTLSKKIKSNTNMGNVGSGIHGRQLSSIDMQSVNLSQVKNIQKSWRVDKKQSNELQFLPTCKWDFCCFCLLTVSSRPVYPYPSLPPTGQRMESQGGRNDSRCGVMVVVVVDVVDVKGSFDGRKNIPLGHGWPVTELIGPFLCLGSQ